MTLSLLLVGLPALAAEPQEVVYVQRGETALFAGMLYPAANAIRVSKKAERCDFVVSEEKQRFDRRIDIEQELCRDKLDLNKETSATKLRVLEERPASPLALAVSFLAGGAVVVLGAWVAGQVR